MHKIERKTSGFLLTFGGVISQEEMTQWLQESQKALENEAAGFCVIVDMRTLAPLTPEVQETMVQGQQLYKQGGMTRSAVIVNNAITVTQFKRLAKESGIYQWERYLDGSQADCMNQAVAWGRDGTDPDA